ncbi:hypothetical protein bpSLO_001079 (plasmid) [Borrelia parkeri]|uniref:hypothetical protein n=1 Tax=Borrelia parkeri TaxID=141 RepID=UPI001FF68282|nr:hypothetical protein [Borrelia parkeri]UPA11233.1 hypothetical protein bpSLO_001079 [Borrelia parkeri]
MKKISIIFYSLYCLGVMSCEQDSLVSLDKGSVIKGLDNLVKTYLGSDKTEKGAESLKGVKGATGKSDVKNSFVVPEKKPGDDLREDLAKGIETISKNDPKEDLAKGIETISKNDPKGILAKASKEVKGNIPENDLEEVYTKLEGRIANYRAQLNNARSQFDPNHHLLHVPFNKVNAKFAALDQQADIYAALQHDVETVRDLGRVLNRLNLQRELPFSQENSTISENNLADNLLMLIWQVGYFTRKVIDVHLSNGNLNRIKASNDVDKLIKITDFLKKFIRVRSNAVQTIQEQIRLLVSKNDKSELLEAIKSTIGLNGDVGKEIQNVSYLIVRLEDNIQLLIN